MVDITDAFAGSVDRTHLVGRLEADLLCQGVEVAPHTTTVVDMERKVSFNRAWQWR
jgi:hypothetical protein